MKREDREWIKALPNTAFMGWLDFKHRLMDRLGIGREQSMRWDVPREWVKAWKSEAMRRK